METQKKRAREAHKSVDILVSDSANSDQSTEFVGYEIANLSKFETDFQECITLDKETYLVFEKTPFYAEMGGQRGDGGTVFINDQSIIITDVIKDANGRFLHKTKEPVSLNEYSGKAILTVNADFAKRFSVTIRRLIFYTGPCVKSLAIM